MDKSNNQISRLTILSKVNENAEELLPQIFLLPKSSQELIM